MMDKIAIVLYHR